jgi:dienelactone hydrolase
MSLPYPHNQKLVRAVTPSMRYRDGENFEEWQEACRAKLAALLGLPYQSCEAAYEPVSEKTYPDHRRIFFQFQSEPGYFVPCCLCIPSGASKPLPVVICLQGHSTGMHISLGETKYPHDSDTLGGDRDFAMQAVRMGFCAITVEQRCFGECGGTADGPDCTSSSLTALLIGRTTIGERVWDVQKLIDLLETGIFPEVDLSRLCCTGNSGGGTTTFYASCLDSRIRFSMPSCSVCTYDSSIANVRHCACNYIPNIRLFFDMGDLGGLIAPRPVVITAGKEDPIFPEHGVREAFQEMERLYRIAGASDRCKLVVGPEGHRFYADLAWPVMREYILQLS